MAAAAATAAAAAAAAGIADEITEVLLGKLSSDGSVRTLADDKLTQLEQHDLPLFLVSLAKQLTNLKSRSLAWEILEKSLVQNWRALDASTKSKVEIEIMEALSLKSFQHMETRRIAALARGIIASNELPGNHVRRLLSNMGGHFAEHKFQALVYICNNVAPNLLTQQEVNLILTGVEQGMYDRVSSSVRLSATMALRSVLPFAQTNLENNDELGRIMKAVGDAVVSPDFRMRQAAFFCLVSLAQATYYWMLKPPVLLQILTLIRGGVEDNEDEVRRAAIAFWTVFCRKKREGNDYDAAYLRFVKDELTPFLLNTISFHLDKSRDVFVSCLDCLGLVRRHFSPEAEKWDFATTPPYETGPSGR